MLGRIIEGGCDCGLGVESSIEVVPLAGSTTAFPSVGRSTGVLSTGSVGGRISPTCVVGTERLCQSLSFSWKGAGPCSVTRGAHSHGAPPPPDERAYCLQFLDLRQQALLAC